MRWPSADDTVLTPRLALEPLTVGHATEMVEALSSPDLYVHIDGTPPALPDLERLYRLQTAGQSPSGDEGWLNWIIRETRSQVAIGYVQATVTADAESPAPDSSTTDAPTPVAGETSDIVEMTGDVAWVVGRSHQCRGYATEAAAAMIAWLRDHDVRSVTASIHPDNRASTRVASHLGLEPTGVLDDDGEETWTLPADRG